MRFSSRTVHMTTSGATVEGGIPIGATTSTSLLQMARTQIQIVANTPSCGNRVSKNADRSSHFDRTEHLPASTAVGVSSVKKSGGRRWVREMPSDLVVREEFRIP
jgi:hypothetical protein